MQLLTAFLPFGKRFIYKRVFGADIGHGVRLGFGAILFFDKMRICDGARISPITMIDSATISIGLRSKIGSFGKISVHSFSLGPSCTVSSQVAIRGNRDDTRSSFSAEAECWIFEHCYIDVNRPVRLGRNVGIGGGTYIFTHGFWLSRLHGYPVSFGEVTIENDAWLPWDCFVMPGVRIGAGCVVGARSLITKDVPPGSLVAGSPAKVIKERIAIDVSLEDRVGILLSHTHEFCTERKVDFSSSDSGDWTIVKFDGQPELAIARTDTAQIGLPLPKGILHVVHEPLRNLDQAIEGAAFSTETFQCTPRASFSSTQASWLQSLRSIGTRHYPSDEVSVESQASSLSNRCSRLAPQTSQCNEIV